MEKFGSRTSDQQDVIRRGLDIVMGQTLKALGFSLDRCGRRHDGDGMLLLAPPELGNRSLVEQLPHLLGVELRKYNSGIGTEGQIRLRVVLHAGEVGEDKNGFTGDTMVRNARLLGSKALHKALARSNGTVALMTTPEYFREHIRGNPAAEPERYWRVRVAEKETKVRAWVCLPDHHVRRRQRRWRSQRHEPRRRRRLPPVKRRVPTAALLVVALVLAGLVSNVFGSLPPDDRCVEPIQLNVTVSAEKASVIQKLMPVTARRRRSTRT
ncbi:MAG TPA: hypothetical protein VGD53_17035 [Actinoallomurus sp.]